MTQLCNIKLTKTFHHGNKYWNKPKKQTNVAYELSKILADEFVLFTKTKNAHWNVEGIDFYDKHKFFEEQANQLNDLVDSVAERIRTLGHHCSCFFKIIFAIDPTDRIKTI